jgi:hypothetical protein
MSDFDELVEKMDAEGVVRALIKSGAGIKYKGNAARPLIQVLPGGTWFVQKKSGRGLGKDVTETLLAALKGKKK